MGVAILIIVFMMIAAIAALGFLGFQRLGQWNRTYSRLGTRYCGNSGRGGVTYGFPFSSPSLTFDYGRTYCTLRNRKSFRFALRRQTVIAMIWADRKIRLEVGTSPLRIRGWGASSMEPVVFDAPQFQSDYFVSSSQPSVAKRLITSSVQWQIEQLRRITGPDALENNEVHISLARGSLVIMTPGYIKQHERLEDFVRLSLELFDQLMLVDAVGIEFLNEDQAMVVENVKCPICSEEITTEMVVCTRCKTPHCQDCWQYNGQCATFACNETRCTHAGDVVLG